LRRSTATAIDNRMVEALDALLGRVAADWCELVQAWRGSDAGRRLRSFIAARQAAGATIYPAEPLRALALTSRSAVRVVIIGQDPYHRPGQAQGLAFSVPAGAAWPPSLRNILAELARDLGVAGRRSDGQLDGWARQGVLLLNTTLTVEPGRPAAHAGQGWEALTDEIVSALAGDVGARVFMLWGAHAQAKAPRIAACGGDRHLVLSANHPSPLSARRPPTPFLGCGHFGRANAFLGAGRAIDWAA
jgi:uracil-DNA glycosylase